MSIKKSFFYYRRTEEGICFIPAKKNRMRTHEKKALLLALTAPLLFGSFALRLGKDANWDFLNYHYYNAYSFLNGRFGFDMAVAHHATFHNPIIDVPFYLLARSAPPGLAGFLLAAVQGLNFTLLFWLALTLFREKTLRTRILLSAAVALFGMTGGGALGQLGIVAYDNVVSLGVLASLLVTATHGDVIFSGPTRPALAWAASAGFAAGTAAGLKLTAVIFPVGLCLAFLMVGGSMARRFLLAFFFGIGVLAGMAVFAGPWCLALWRETGNPLFPYFNSIFESPLLGSAFNRDATFIPLNPAVRIFFPFFFTFDPYRAAEFFFRDIKILIAFILVPTALVFSRVRGKRGDFSHGSRHLMIGAGLSYCVWLALFCIYRYIIALEMLAPLLIAVSLEALAASRRLRLISLALILGVSQAAAHTDFDERLPWGDRYVSASVPMIENPGNTIILIAGYAPLAYLIPFFPPEIPFLRIQSWLSDPDDPESGYSRIIHRRIAAHGGDFYALFLPAERSPAESALAAHRLKLDAGACRTVRSSLSDSPELCRVLPLR